MSTTTKSKVISIASVIGIAVLCIGGSILYDNLSGGPEAREASINANKVILGQEEAQATADCRATYAVADRVSSSNLDVTKSEVISLFAKAAIIGNTEPLRDLFRQAKARDDRARAERIAVAGIQAASISNCKPDHPGGRELAPTVEPIEALEEP